MRIAERGSALHASTRYKHLVGMAVVLAVAFGLLGMKWHRKQMAASLEAEQSKYDYCESQVSNWVCLSKGSQLDAFLAAELRKARDQKLRPIVYVGAAWCPPCQALKRSLREPEMRAALTGTYVIELSLDNWSNAELDRYGLDPKELPTFFAVDGLGHAMGPKITGTAWDESTPAAIAVPLKAFVSSIRS